MTPEERRGEKLAAWLAAQPYEVRDSIVLSAEESRAFWRYIAYCLRSGE